MDTPKYITFKQTKDGRIYRVEGFDTSINNSISGPRFVAVIFTGDGKVMDTVHAEKIEEINPRALRAYYRAQESWAASSRVKDPPMWDRYERTSDATGAASYKRDR